MQAEILAGQITQWASALVRSTLSRTALCLCLALASAGFGRADGVVTNCTETDLRAALSGGGSVTFACDGVIGLSGPLIISNDITVDAAGHEVTISGGNSVRLFEIKPGAALVLKHLSLADGFARGTNSSVGNGSGGDGIGGAVWNQAGTLQATDCVFANNAAFGGLGGPGVSGTIAFNFGGGGFGGAIYNDTGTLRLTNVVFSGNVAQGGQGGPAPSSTPSKGGSGGPSVGGAIYSRTGLVTIASCRFISNSAPASVPGPANGYNPSSGSAVAGALYCNAGTTLIFDTRFEHQSVGGGRWFCDASAGAVFQAAGSLWVSGCTFATNTVTGGDGIIIGSGSNAGSADGGALLVSFMATGVQGQVLLFCDAVISNSCFVGNVAKGGLQGPAVGEAGYARGGAVASSGNLQMLNCTLAANVARGGDITFPSFPLSSAYGGALFLNNTSILTHVTIAANRVNTGTGAGSFGSSSSVALGGGVYLSSGKVYVRNSILSSNVPSNCAGSLIDNGNSISSDATCAFTAPGSRNKTDPMLVPLGAYGGPTLTMALRPGSPAIDAASPAFCLATDQRGVPRPQGRGCDIGAVEAAILSLQKRNDGNWGITRGAVPGATCTLQTSANLLDWIDLQTVVADQNGRVEFLVPDAASSVQFFRSAGEP